MKKALLMMIAILCATPAFADDDASAREKERKFFNFSAPPSSNSDETRITDKGCLEYAMPLWFRNKYGKNQGMNILQNIHDKIISKDILDTKTCTCKMLYQKWDKAIAIYENDFAKLNPYAPYGSETQKTLTQLNIQSQTAITAARDICQKTGAL